MLTLVSAGLCILNVTTPAPYHPAEAAATAPVRVAAPGALVLAQLGVAETAADGLLKLRGARSTHDATFTLSLAAAVTRNSSAAGSCELAQSVGETATTGLVQLQREKPQQHEGDVMQRPGLV